MRGIDATEIARLHRALERMVAVADEYGDITGVTGLADIARRALAGEDISPGSTAHSANEPDPVPADKGRRASYVLASFIVTEDGERQHPMDVAVVKLNLGADGLPNEASISDLVRRVTRAALRKMRARHA